MTIVEEKNTEAPDLKHPRFVVDHRIKQVVKPFPEQASYIVFCGASRSGKSSLMTSLLMISSMYKRVFHNVLLCIPEHSFTSMSTKDNPFIGLDEDKIFHDFDYDTLDLILHQIEYYAEQHEDTLLIIDDYASELKNPKLLRLLCKMVNNRRHERLSIWMSVQTYRSIPLSNRRTINYLVLFKMKNKAETKAVFDEMGGSLTKEQFNEMLKFVYDKPHEYLVCNRDHDEWWKGFNRLVIT